MKDFMTIVINPNGVRQRVKIREAIDKLTYQMDPKYEKRREYMRWRRSALAQGKSGQK